MDDLISRQAAIDEWKNDFKGYINALNIPKDDYNGIMEYIDELPFAQPKHGYWTESHEHIYLVNGVKEWTNWYCSECDAPNGEPTDFCPSCGADMRGEENGRYNQPTGGD